VVAVVPELRFVSVLFVDLVGFTALSEGREAEDVRELLGRYFLSARTVVERYGGVIEKFIGDAVMAVWGAPVAREDDAERAVRAALEIVDAVSAFGGEVRAPDLRARAGAVTGQVAALENPGEGIVVGDKVNTASRVQSAAGPGAVLVDEVTRQLGSAAIVYEDAGEHRVKGKVEPLRLWRAVRVVAGAGGREREGLVEAPFVGRDTELRLVRDLLRATVERRATRLVAITGEAGVGKSRLRREFSNYTDGLADTFLWHLGRCLSHGDGIAYWALAEMVRQRFGIPEDAPSQELGALLGVAEPGLDRPESFAGWRLFAINASGASTRESGLPTRLTAAPVGAGGTWSRNATVGCASRPGSRSGRATAGLGLSHQPKRLRPLDRLGPV
jgi:class 3 adenylate cyclase